MLGKVHYCGFAADKQKINQRYPLLEGHQSEESYRQSIELRLCQTQARLDKLTDLLIDEKIEQATHDRKRGALQIELAKLQDEQRQLTTASDDEQDRQKFLEVIKNVAGLYEAAAPLEKRVPVENYLLPGDLKAQAAAFDLALCLGMIRRTSGVGHAVVVEPFGQLA